ncbi:MAG: GNAT family N-acetyltransferase [Chloroflexi bacterium]|nr:GNAT family N-acetyltransferase [Chloroflexota bacterium]
MIEVQVGDVERRELEEAAGVLARGMRDNPVHIAMFRGDPLSRVPKLDRMFRAALPTMDRPPLCARRDGWIVGVSGLAEPGHCRPSLLDAFRVTPAVLRAGPGPVSRGLRILRAWAGRDPKEPHWHLGPVAVDGGLQGLGIGSRMLERFCGLVDARGDMAYLETDKPENVPFYQKFGFETVDEADVPGVHSWFMVRPAAGR